MRICYREGSWKDVLWNGKYGSELFLGEKYKGKGEV